MELHETIRELVDGHGRSIFDDSTGFRGVLDDVLAEDDASTGDINLLVDAVRFDALGPLTEMIDGGADPARAVEEAGMRLARNRGGDDHQSSSWAAAVLGYSVGKVPEAVVLRYRSHRPPSSNLPPPGTAPSGPPVQSPAQTIWPSNPPQQAGPPTVMPGHGSAPQPYQAPTYGVPNTAGSVPGPGSVPPPGPYGGPQVHGFTTPPKKKSPIVWIAAAVAGIVIVAGGVVGVVLATGGEDDPDKKTKETTSKSGGDEVDVTPEAIDGRYDALASKITTGATDCKAGEPADGQSEVVECTVSGGTLQLVTYEDPETLVSARTARLDYRAGTLSSDNGNTAVYGFDPERGGSSDPAIVYWDNKNGPQSATITGPDASLETLLSLYNATSPRVSEPTSPSHPTLREFVNINMDVSTCTRQATFFTGETEESNCESGTDGVVVSVGRFSTRKGLTSHRKYYKGEYDAASTRGGGPVWRFTEGPNEGAYFAYNDDDTAILYWDWNKSDCYCYGIAYQFDGNLSQLEKWWPAD